MPKKHLNSYKALPLDTLGADRAVSTKVIGWAHDRTHVLNLKHFASENLSVASKPMKSFQRHDEDGSSTLTDLSWESPDTTHKIQEAFLNYSAIMFNLWPYDHTGISMQRLMHRYKWCSSAADNSKRLHILKSFFDDTLRINAERAVNETCILSYSEQEALLKDIMLHNGTRPEIPLFQPYNQQNNFQQKQSHQNKSRKQNNFQNNYQNSPSNPPFNNSYNQSYSQPFNQAYQQTQNQGYQRSQTNQQTSSSANQSKSYANIGGISCCRHFNNENGGHCRNQKTQKGCHVPGSNGQPDRDYLHNCNKFVRATNSFCLKSHPRKDHR